MYLRTNISIFKVYIHFEISIYSLKSINLLINLFLSLFKFNWGFFILIEDLAILFVILLKLWALISPLFLFKFKKTLKNLSWKVPSTRGKSMVLFHLVMFPLTFEAYLDFPFSLSRHSCLSSSFIFSGPIWFFSFHNSFFDPTLIFDALSIEIPPKPILHACSS